MKKKYYKLSFRVWFTMLTLAIFVMPCGCGDGLIRPGSEVDLRQEGPEILEDRIMPQEHEDLIKHDIAGAEDRLFADKEKDAILRDLDENEATRDNGNIEDRAPIRDVVAFGDNALISDIKVADSTVMPDNITMLDIFRFDSGILDCETGDSFELLPDKVADIFEIDRDLRDLLTRDRATIDLDVALTDQDSADRGQRDSPLVTIDQMDQGNIFDVQGDQATEEDSSGADHGRQDWSFTNDLPGADYMSSVDAGTERECNNGVDDDRDGLTDCADPDCSSPLCPEDCQDTWDNDEDGWVDCADNDCEADPACPVIYVDIDATGANDGISWVDAFTSLQAAMDVARREIWVAEGFYGPPLEGPTLVMREGIHVYGGFAGIEGRREERDWATHLTIIEGVRYESPDESTAIIGASWGTLDGFTLEWHGDPYFEEPVENLLSLVDVEGVEIKNCIFQNGSRGINIDTSSEIVIDRCQFELNNRLRPPLEGGGIAVYNSQVTVTNSSFRNNQATNFGGAIYLLSMIYNQNTTVANCVFETNVVEKYGGGALYIDHRGYFLMLDSIFKSNLVRGYESIGGAILLSSEGSGGTTAYSEIKRCTFLENEAGSGGGIDAFLTGSYNLNVSDSIFSSNKNGAVVIYNGQPSAPQGAVIKNCIFSDNDCGICSDFQFLATISNCVFSENVGVGGLGSKIINSTFTGCDTGVTWLNSGHIINSIFWGNDVNISYSYEEYPPLVSYSLVSGGFPGVGNIGGDPLFVQPGHWEGEEWIDGDYHLLPNSPCIDSANGNEAPAEDFEHHPRYDDPLTPNTGMGTPPFTDMGALEYQGNR